MTQPAPPSAERLTYQVGAFALVRQRDNFLLVRPHKLLLPGGPQSLPGFVLEASNPGRGIVETALRRVLLSQVGISVGDLRLVGSHIVRVGSERQPVSRLNLIFGSEYCSGILNPQPDALKSALWIPRMQLEGQVPEWLRAALQEMLASTVPEAPSSSQGVLGFFGRRNAEKR